MHALSLIGERLLRPCGSSCRSARHIEEIIEKPQQVPSREEQLPTQAVLVRMSNLEVIGRRAKDLQPVGTLPCPERTLPLVHLEENHGEGASPWLFRWSDDIHNV